MSEAYWQAKIWGLLHDPVLKALHNNGSGRGENSFWQQLPVMQNWVDNGWNPESSGGTVMKHIHQADWISSASDRGAIGSIIQSVSYNDRGLEIAHLLSGAKLDFKIPQHSEVLKNRREYLQKQEQNLLDKIPTEAKKKENYKQLHWWLWRCLPEAVCQEFQDKSLILMPAETRFPDSSIWSHASITAALSGALAGYDLTTEQLKRWSSQNTLSHPYLASFTFTPVQELIKASRKMRDFWAGSWILHYLCAKVSWQLALQYGPDTLLYPSLFQQPLIDHWLLQKYPDFKDWIDKPCDRKLLTAGFPNVIVLILPKDKVKAAMQTAEQTVKQAWQEISKLVFEELQDNRHWMPNLQADSKTWEGWLQSQWQFYWAAMPIGKDEKGLQLKNTICFEEEKETLFQQWIDTQNQAYNLQDEQTLFKPKEREFLLEAAKLRFDTQHRKFSINVGSWWASIFDQTRYTLTSVKNARNWQLPTAFGPRSTVSGIGPVVHPQQDWVSEGDTKKCWQRQAGLFDGREQLNATETVKRCLEKILPELLTLEDTEQIEASYPDLTAGVAGYLKVMEETERLDHWKHFNQACQTIMHEFEWTQEVIEGMRSKWGIPWIDNRRTLPKKNHPRLLNAGWLVEDGEAPNIEELKQDYRCSIQKVIDRFYPNNNPASWYVLAAGDGDGMSQWLKGIPLKDYLDYIPQDLKNQIQKMEEGDKERNQSIAQRFKEFLTTQKRIGPSTHNALSRALLDFSNELVPYLTEQRYAGRLIYGGGDDVLAYTNLWEWDRWLWDIRQCFQGKEDPRGEFQSRGDYWQLPATHSANSIAKRPLFTMGERATISFGIAIAHHSVPLAITLENMWEAEKEAKDHISPDGKAKDAVQVRVLYGNGNILKATAKFLVFHKWQELLNLVDIDAAIFEQAANLWSQHPAPVKEAVAPWTHAFCDRRELLQGDGDLKEKFQKALFEFLEVCFIEPQRRKEGDTEVELWLKLAAFTVRQRIIEL
ncbi:MULTISPECIES: type III-B CRISPR-associated protein Cas10/Cmr2 [Nostocales]|uniref:CRISPR-associated protein Crm2 n=2 Tax=Nostocales TaxID=1161 RepID=A0A0C1RD06_9CYAN|nr:type III-B CRISPR-associated protein Cas10/Cmr2 [Tolypothrix bouteillei]KAF3886052.1 type III-B CRISPR-associated protein Cas10/Cmr2 [Tolypothrix bouteillei VB521301]